jgi:hypothetical protein
MNRLGISSDQLFTWSATHDQKAHVRLAKAPPGPAAQTPLSFSDSPRLAHRTLQALWQARLQMCQGSRSWSQVLSLRKLSPFAPANGLCAAGVSRPDQEASRQLSACSRSFRADLRDQSRTTAPQRGALRNHDERFLFLAHRANRSRIGRRSPRQYARGLARRRSKLVDNRGGER